MSTSGVVGVVVVLAGVIWLGGCGAASDGAAAAGSSTTGSAASPSPPSPSPPSPSSGLSVSDVAARRYVDAVNSGNTEQVMATLADDAVVVDSGRRFADGAAIRAWLEAEVTGVSGRITVRAEQPNADGTVLKVDFRSSAFSGTDLVYTFRTRGDRITHLTLGYS